MPRLTQVARDELPALAAETYLNTGGAGPLPRAAATAIAARVGQSLRVGRMSVAASTLMEEAHAAVRGRLADLLHAGPDEIALTSSVTSGLCQVIWGIDWRAGDEVVTTNLEHPGLTVPLGLVARRHGVRVRIVELASGGEDLEARVDAVCGPRTRMVAVSHVSWTTGARMDVEGAARAAGRVGALVLVDGAQGVGAVVTDPRALGADAYAFPAQKWLLGPEGLASLWVAREALDRISLTFGGMGSGTDHTGDGTLVLHPGARRFELGVQPEILIPGWTASLDWLGGLGDPPGSAGSFGWDWIARRTADVVAMARTVLDGAGATVLTPVGREAGLLTFTLPGLDAETAANALDAGGVVLRWVPQPRALRASFGFFTDRQDLARLAEGLDDLIG